MNGRILLRLAWFNMAVCLAFYVAALALHLHNRPIPDWQMRYAVEIYGLASWAVLYPAMGLFILANRPTHKIGWIFCAVGTLSAVAIFATQYVIYGIQQQPNLPPLVAEFNWFRNFTWMLLVVLLAFLFVYYPDGRLPSPRWRWPARLLALSTALILLVAFLGGWPVRHSAPLLGDPNNPNASVLILEPWDRLDIIAVGILFVTLLVSASAPFWRWRRANATVRQQLKWFMVAASLFAATLIGSEYVINFMFQTDVARSVAGSIWSSLTAAIIPLAVTLAILRYRLYDIDIIIRKTLVYSVLTVLLALFFFGVVGLLQAVFGRVTGVEQSPLAVVVSTLAIAALFTPLRRRIQEVIDRRFFRQKYDAQQVLAQFTQIARDETDLDALTGELARVTQEAMQPEKVRIWLAKPGAHP